MKRLHHQNGFTLLELLVAVSIFAVVTTMAYAGLQTILNSSDRITEQSKQLAELQLAFTILSRDLQLSVPRPVRDQFGDTKPAFYSGTADQLLELTHNGVVNLLDQNKSDLQRITYSFEEEQLKRNIWPTLDQTQAEEPQEMVLLDKVQNVEIRLLNENGEWGQDWSDENHIAMPVAVEVLVETAHWGVIKRLIQIPGH
ncbi:MAG: type II secretion system minor pseudopilin GspJ [Gammaproteobacteria bacterium]|nr:type II secretion system minor pseudopilin GspJ [Gammaproteobacteria bacterium]MDH5594729.1 type II secretion system minor pseudopilin GspJ [Gammaproteobacteria bacterium]MDH5614126.1 type II secretion system minor pseudopilin GspJ [Gammaproteobacteria bacterium]